MAADSSSDGRALGSDGGENLSNNEKEYRSEKQQRFQADENRRATVYKDQDRALTYSEAYEILCNADASQFSILPPVRPVGGQMYIFSPENRDYHTDCYRWCTSTGFHAFPKKDPVVLRKCKKLLTEEKPVYGDSRFVMYVHKLPSKLSPILTHYVGDEQIFKSRPHGNEKKQPMKDFFGTAPSLRLEIKQSASENVPPQRVYESMKNKPDGRINPAFAPRDLKQVQNLQYAQNSENRLSHDPLYELYVLGFEFPDFIREHRVSFECQNNVVFLMSRPLLDKLNILLKPPTGVYDKLTELYYDTTFQIGQFYVSILSYRHYTLTGDPTIPFAFLIHQRKYWDDHKSFLSLVKQSCPNLGTKAFSLITDREFKEVDKIFPSVKHFFCWNHIKGDVRHWTRERRHQGPQYQRKSKEVTYVDDIETLLKAESIQEYDELVMKLKPYWAEKFVEYFETSLTGDLTTKACRFVISDKVASFDEWSGITSNAAESINAVIKRCTGKPISISEAALIFQHIANYYDYEINDGMYGIGKYVIKSEFGCYKRNILDRGIVDPPIPLSEIVPFIKEKANLNFAQMRSQRTVASDQRAAEEKGCKLDDSTEVQMKKKLDSSILFDKMIEKKEKDADSLQMSLARELCDKGKVTLVCERKAFVVENNEGRKYCVMLFPKETCQCPAPSTCYHILAARLSVGMLEMKTKGRKNMACMFNRKRKRPDRNPGKKAPKKLDYVKPCPDIMGLDSNKNQEANDSSTDIQFKRPMDKEPVSKPVQPLLVAADNATTISKMPPAKSSSEPTDSWKPSAVGDQVKLPKSREEDRIENVRSIIDDFVAPTAAAQTMKRKQLFQTAAAASTEKKSAAPIATKDTGVDETTACGVPRITAESSNTKLSEDIQHHRNGTNTTSIASTISIDKNEELFCLCNKKYFGKMVACDNKSCDVEWFHFPCVGLKSAPKGKWYCPTCRGGRSNLPKRFKPAESDDAHFVSHTRKPPKKFKFVPVTSPWMRQKCNQLNLKYYDEQENRQARTDAGIEKMVFDSPPKKTTKIRGDGNCLFRTLSHVLSNNEDQHRQLRSLVCNQIRKDEKRYLAGETAPEYLSKTRMENNTVYGTDIEIRAAADLLQTTIWVYGPQVGRSMWLYHQPQVDRSDEAIYIVNRGEHFEPLYVWEGQ